MIEDHGKEIKRVSKEIEENRKEIEENGKEIKRVAKEIEENGKEIEENGKEIERVAKKIKENGKEIEENQKEIERVDKEIQKHGKKLEEVMNKLNEFNTIFMSFYNRYLIQITQNNKDKNEIINGLEEVEFNEQFKDKEEIKCAICLENFSIGDKISYLPCFHSFHSSCIKNWIKIKNKCPLCNNIIKLLKIKIKFSIYEYLNF